MNIQTMSSRDMFHLGDCDLQLLPSNQLIARASTINPA